MAELSWGDAQWQKVNDTVTEAFDKASVATAFLPMYGPLTGSAEVVRNERLLLTFPRTVSINADHEAVNLKLVNLTVNVELSSEQVSDEALSNALLAFRRAANILALEEDRIVFGGYLRGFPSEDSPGVFNKVGPQKGLADLPARRTFAAVAVADPQNPLADPGEVGQAVVTNVVRAVGLLEQSSNPGPFACVLGNDLFNCVHTPSSSLVLPSDRITPQLKGGPLLRSGMMDPGTGIVVSLAGRAIDLVVGTPPMAQFIQRLPDAKFLFRVYERFVLRIRDKDKMPVAGFRISPDAARDEEEVSQLVELALDAAVVPFQNVIDRLSGEPAAARGNVDPDAARKAILAAARKAI